MAARAIWKGRIRFGEVDVPVKLYSAVQDRSVHFRLLDAKRHEPVRQKMVDPGTGRTVESDEIQRALPLDEGEMVVLTAEEMAEAEPPESRDIRVTRFVPPDQITHAWYDRPYYLGPDESEGAYWALAGAMAKGEVEGVARWTMRKKAYAGALRAEGPYLVLITLRSPAEVVPASALEPPSGRALDEREISMARQLVGAMEDELDLSAYRDEYRERVLELVEAKAAGKVVEFPQAPAKREEADLASVLEKSLAAAKKKKGGSRAA